jgi:RNA polymerase sigma-70 factor (ECF subfamily)
MSMPRDDAARLPNKRFATTRWSMVMAAGLRGSPQSSKALSDLCQDYWYPLYSFVRHQGYAAHDAQDLTQGFFARLLEKNFLDDVHRERGRFRSFLLAALKHFIANERDRARAKKRGGGHSAISWNPNDAESKFCAEPATELTAERIFDRQWALSVLDRSLARLQKEYEQSGKGTLFETLKSTLGGQPHSGGYAALGEKLQLSESATKVAIHRLRRRYRAALQAEIAETVADPAEIEQELRDLLAALG